MHRTRLADLGASRWWLGLVAVGFAVLLAVIAPSLPPHEDGYQYIAAAAFSADGLAIYRDYFHSQTPYMPLAMGAWTGWLAPDGPGLYLAARGFNLLWSGVFLVALAVMVWRLSRHGLWAAAILAIVLTSSYLDLSLRVVRNDMMALALMTLALLACLAVLGRKPDIRAATGYGLAGVAMGAAVMTKQSLAFPAIGLFAFALFMAFPGWRARLRVAALPVALGGLAGGAPGLWIVLSRWDVATYALLEFHRTAHVGPFISNPDIGLTYGDILDWTVMALLDLSALCLVAGIAAGLLWWTRRAPGAAEMRPRERLALWVCVFLAVPILASFALARPLFPQYAAPLLPVLAMTAAILVGRLVHEGVLGGIVAPMLVGAVAAAGGVGLLPHNPGKYNKSVLDHARSLVGPPPSSWQGAPYFMRVTGERRWLPQMLDPLRDQVDAIVAPERRPGLEVATLMPPYMLEAGFDVPVEFAGAPFFFVSNDALSAERLALFNGVAPAGLGDWAAAEQPAAILIGTGYFEDLTIGLEAYARATEMSCFEIGLRGAYRTNSARLYIDPAHVRENTSMSEC